MLVITQLHLKSNLKVKHHIRLIGHGEKHVNRHRLFVSTGFACERVYDQNTKTGAWTRDGQWRANGRSAERQNRNALCSPRWPTCEQAVLAERAGVGGAAVSRGLKVGGRERTRWVVGAPLDKSVQTPGLGPSAAPSHRGGGLITDWQRRRLVVWQLSPVPATSAHLSFYRPSSLCGSSGRNRNQTVFVLMYGLWFRLDFVPIYVPACRDQNSRRRVYCIQSTMRAAFRYGGYQSSNSGAHSPGWLY